MGLEDGADCGAWKDDGEVLGFDERERVALVRKE